MPHIKIISREMAEAMHMSGAEREREREEGLQVRVRSLRLRNAVWIFKKI